MDLVTIFTWAELPGTSDIRLKEHKSSFDKNLKIQTIRTFIRRKSCIQSKNEKKALKINEQKLHQIF